MNQPLYDFYIVNKAHRAWRIHPPEMAEAFNAQNLSAAERMCRRFEQLCAMERPHIQPFEQIAMVRTVNRVPECWTSAQWDAVRAEHFVHELGYASNLCPDYASVIAQGLLAQRAAADCRQRRCIDALIDLCDRYLQEAICCGREDLARVFTQVPRYGARNFHEALQFFRILHFALWLEGDYHNTIGRFDQYMAPYFEADMACGVLNRESALALLEDFFISFNKDSDLYPGVQQGDNGQSMVLGGTDAQGRDGFTQLSALCLEASGNLKLIDPKLNLRVNGQTPQEVFELGTKLTRAGLGFPQYSNDDVVIPALERLGYAPEDAQNYVVAACWEFIIPGCGDDIPNIGALNFPLAAHRAICGMLEQGGDFDAVLEQTRREIQAQCRQIMAQVHDLFVMPSPVLDLLRSPVRYRNFGIHGCGLAPAVDALAAVRRYVFEEKSVSVSRLLRGLDQDYQDDPELFHLLRYEAPKMGQADPRTDQLASVLLRAFADAVEGKRNCCGGIWRAGTGSAMFYVWQGQKLGATADGRRSGEAFGANYSPSLFAKLPGPVSVVESFTAPDLSRTINGGPLTLEFAAGTLRDDESVRKVAAFVRYFILRGGHQLQLNAVDLETLRQAQLHPECYPRLIVRVWGWSAYFVELDRCYQDHVMARQEYAVQ